jgi:hypothetical protein
MIIAMIDRIPEKLKRKKKAVLFYGIVIVAGICFGLFFLWFLAVTKL